MPTDLTALREGWEEDQRVQPELVREAPEEYAYRAVVTSRQADDLARRAYDAGVADCIADVRQLRKSYIAREDVGSDVGSAIAVCEIVEDRLAALKRGK